jgi:hypothetical protein
VLATNLSLHGASPMGAVGCSSLAQRPRAQHSLAQRFALRDVDQIGRAATDGVRANLGSPGSHPVSGNFKLAGDIRYRKQDLTPRLAAPVGVLTPELNLTNPTHTSMVLFNADIPIYRKLDWAQ